MPYLPEFDTPSYDDINPGAQKQSQQPAVPAKTPDLKKLVDFTANHFGVDGDVLAGMLMRESMLKPDVISGQRKSTAGAVGIAQFMPGTADRYGIDATDPEQSVIAMGAYLRDNLQKFGGNYEKAIAGYNWGEARPALQTNDWRAKAPTETREYVDFVTEFAAQLRASRQKPEDGVGTNNTGKTPQQIEAAAGPHEPGMLSQIGSGLKNAWGIGSGGTARGIGDFVQAPGEAMVSGIANLHAAAAGAGVGILPGEAPTDAMGNVIGEAPATEPARTRNDQAIADASRGSAREQADIAELARQQARRDGTTLGVVGGAMTDAGKNAQEHYGEQMRTESPEMVRQQQAIEGATGFVDTLKASAVNPLGTMGTVVQSLPDTAVGAGVGSLAARGVSAALRQTAEKAGKAAFEAVWARAPQMSGTSAEITLAARQAQQQAIRDVLSAGGHRAAGAASNYAEGFQSGASTGAQIKDLVDAKNPDGSFRFSDADLVANSPRFSELLGQGHNARQARTLLGAELADEASPLASLWTRAAGKLSGAAGAEGRVLANGKITARQALQNIGKEGLEEALQNPGEDYAGFASKVQVDPSQEFDLGGSVAQGVIGGLAQGGPMHGAGYLQSRATNFTEPNSPSARAGLTPIVVPASKSTATVEPVPAEDQEVYDGIQGALAALAAGASARGNPDAGAGLDDVRRVPDVGAGSVLSVPAGDTGSLGTAEPVAPQADPAGAADVSLTPAEQWLGRSGTGYATTKDAEQALPGRAQRQPNLDWKVEADGNGRFAVNGYAKSAVDERAHEAATSPNNDLAEPTQAQKEAGNYRKGHIAIDGLNISIENPRGSERKGVDKGGKPWSVTMANHYGYIKGTTGADKDHVDVIVGPNPAAGKAFVVDQVHPVDGTFDEHKVVLGADNVEQAKEVYAANYAPGWNGMAGITEMPMAQFKVWVRAGAKTRPLTDLKGASNAAGSSTNVATQAAVPAGVGAGIGVSAALGGAGGAAGAAEIGGPATDRIDGETGGVDELQRQPDSGDADASGEFSDNAGAQGAGSSPLDAEATQQILTGIQNVRLRHFGEPIKLTPIQAGASVDTDTAQKLARVFGKPIIFAKLEKPKGAAGFSAVNANRAIVVTSDAQDAHVALTMHEILHSMPADIKKALLDALRPHMKVGQHKADFPSYRPEIREEEVAASLAQQHAKTAEFWRDLHAKMGDSKFARLAEHILSALDAIVGRFTHFQLKRYANDIERVRDALTTAYAETARRKAGGQSTEFSENPRDFTDPEERAEVSTTKPKPAKSRTDNSVDQKWVISKEDITSSKSHVEAVAKALRGYNTLSGKGKPAELMDELHEAVVDNLLWLHDLVPANVRARAKLWYDGANAIASDWTQKYGITERQAAGVLAVLSPQMDWFKNVSLAERVISVWRDRQNEPWSPAMTAWVKSWVGAAKTVDEKEARSRTLETAERLEGTPLYEMSNADAAVFARVFDETYHERRYRLVTPEGGFGDYVTKNDDGESSVTWGGFSTIEKAMAILNDGSFRNLDTQLGDEHKVRNFNNNIIRPNSADGHVTIDTHAVAAALVKALSGSTQEVKDNFGGAGQNAATGAGGTYALFADAYRDAAAQRGLLAREMQSITWEAVRALFPASIKDQLAPQVDAVWNRFKSGEITRDKARKEVLALSGGIREMAWEGSDAGKRPADGGTSFDADLDADQSKRAARALEPVATKDKVNVTLSAATGTIPGLRALYEQAGKGDEYAHQLLQDIALDSLRHLLAGTSAKIKAERATGLYDGSVEPSLGLNVTFTDSDRATVLAGIAKFGENFNQEQIHVRGGTKAKPGTVFDDGSYATPVYRWALKKALDRKQIQKIINQSGLYGLTFGDDFVEAYYVGDPANEEARAEFDLAIGRADSLLGQAADGVGRQVARLWPYGHGAGAIGYERIRGDVAAGPAAESDTARRIAEYLNRVGTKPGRVRAFAQAAEVTPAQAELQREIARVYESLPDNDLKNPRVKRAYAELAKEVKRQFQALPVKVEVITGEGEPYKNSDAMRRDVLDNNHLFIFGTTPETFGPEGADFSGHPLLEDSGLTDSAGTPLLYNDLLRAVHDYFAHTMAPTQFGPKGEEAAWRNHMASTANVWARWALTSETRGQNSWVNFNPAAADVPVKDRPFARQKAALMPTEYMLTGDRAVDAATKTFIAATPVAQRIGSKPERDVEFADNANQPGGGRLNSVSDVNLFDALGKVSRHLDLIAYDASLSDAKMEEVLAHSEDLKGLQKQFEMGQVRVTELEQAFGDASKLLRRIGQSTLDSNAHKTFWFGAISAADRALADIAARPDAEFADNQDEEGAEFAFDLNSIKQPPKKPVTRATDGWLLSRNELGRFRFGAGQKLYDAIAHLAGKVAAKIEFKPMGPELRRALRQMKLEVSKAQSKTAEVAVQMGKMSKEHREMISDIIEGELKSGVVPPKQVLDIAATISAMMSQQSDDLVDVGMLSPEAADKWRDRYLPRFYESKLRDKATAKWDQAVAMLTRKPTALKGIGGKSLKRRGLTEVIDVKNLPAYEALGWRVDDSGYQPGVHTRVAVHRDFSREERENMGEIRDSMFRFVMGYSRSQKDLALGRLYEHLSDTVASRHALDGYVQVPDTRIDGTDVSTYGKLAGQYVPQEVLSHLTQFGESEHEAVLKAYRKALGMWKEGKTVLNPVSHMNNVVSNLTMAHFAGVSYWDGHKYAQTMRDFVTGGGMLAEAREAGLFGGSIGEAELMNMMPKDLQIIAKMTESSAAKGVEFVWNAMSLFLRKPMGVAYQAEDMFFRHLLFREARSRGLHENDAVDYAQNYIFSYDDLPRGARLLRDTALPFFSYTYKAAPVLLHTALAHPWRYAAPWALLTAVNSIMYAVAKGAEDDDDWQESIRRYVKDPAFRQATRDKEKMERENLPPWMKGSGFVLQTPKTIRLGTDDLTQLPVFLDTSRFFPGGDLLDVHSNTGGMPWLQNLTPSNPLLSTLTAMMYNRDPYFGKDVVDANDTTGEAATKRGQWMWQQFAPAISANGYVFNRSMNAVAQASGSTISWWPEDFTGIGKDGLPIQPKYAAMQNIGIKARPIDLDAAAQISEGQKKKMIHDIEGEIRSLRRLENKGALSAAQAEAKIDAGREKIQRLRSGLTVDGDEKE